MSDLDTAAAILADVTGLPVTDPHIVTDAARIAPRLATMTPEELRAQVIADCALQVRAVTAALRELAERSVAA